MSQVPLPDAVEALDYAALRALWLARYAELMSVDVEDLNDNDPAVKALEVGAYREMLRTASINYAVQNTMLASASGAGLDDLGADPLYELDRLTLDEGDEDAVPPVAPTYESDSDYLGRLQLAPATRSGAGPSGSYEVRALSAHADVVDVKVLSPDPCMIVVQVLHDSEDMAILTDVEAALSAATVRPVGDRVSVMAAEMEPTTAAITLYVPDGPDLAAVQAASQARIEEIVYPLAAKVGSGDAFAEGAEHAWLGACQVEGVRAWEVTASTGMSLEGAAWWPLEVTVTAVRSNA